MDKLYKSQKREKKMTFWKIGFKKDGEILFQVAWEGTALTDHEKSSKMKGLGRVI